MEPVAEHLGHPIQEEWLEAHQEHSIREEWQVGRQPRYSALGAVEGFLSSNLWTMGWLSLCWVSPLWFLLF